MSVSVSAFAFSRSLTVDTSAGGANIAGTLTDFPVCIVVNSTSWSNATERGHFFDASNTAGKRVQFYVGGSSVPYEVEQYDGSGQTAVYWVKATVTGNSTTAITVGYGNDPNGSAQDAATSVWDANYATVMHLSGTGPSVADSTSHGHNGTNHSGAAATGMADGGVAFDATTKYLDVLGGPSGSNARTIEGWVKTSDTGVRVLYDQGALTPAHRFLIYNVAGTNYITIEWNSANIHGAVNVRNGAWHHWSGTSAGGSSGTVSIEVDGAPDGAVNVTLDTTATPSYLSASLPSGASNGNIGSYDEFRISTIARSTGWLKGSYFSLKTTSWPGDGWLTIGAEIAGGVNLKVRRSSTWDSGAVKVRRSGVWAAPTAVKVRRGGAWTTVT